jgi:ABC-type multidrug transport system ATPase subunit
MLQIIIPSYQVNPHFNLSHLKIEIKKGEIFSLIGKSGSGKSTVAKIAVGLNLSYDSSIKSNGLDVNINSERLIPQFIVAGYVPQSLHLKPHHTVEDYLNYLFQKETEINKIKLLKSYIKMFHIQHLLKSKIQMLSGGEKQKIALIEAVSKPIEYLILDEPFSQLDTEQKMEFLIIIQQLIESRQIPCLLISHDLSDIIRLSHKIGIMEKGKLVFQGNKIKFWNSKNKIALRLKDAMISWKQATDYWIKNQNTI